MDETLTVLRRHLAACPEMTVQDAVKLLYQNEFGPGHMIPDEAAALSYLRRELETVQAAPGPAYTDVGNGLVRLELAALKDVLTPETLCRMFTVSANAPRGDAARFRAKLDLLYSLPFPKTETDAFLAAYRTAGFPAVHHSDRYRAAYAPAYRVAERVFGQFAAVFAAIDRQRTAGTPVLVAIDGRCTAGKSTLGDAIGRVYGCPVFHMDDYYLPAEKRTPERYAEPGGNVDRERFRAEILRPWSEGRDVEVRRFDHSVFQPFPHGDTVPWAPLAVTEGSYSLHPELRDYYTLRVFLSVPREEQLRRVEKRNGPEAVAAFRDRWIPLEEAYFAALDPRACADLVFE